MSARVRDYHTGLELPGRPTRELVRASNAASPTGAVLAHRVGSWWHYVRSDQESFFRAHLRAEVVTVWVES